jgi:hypothetical protein
VGFGQDSLEQSGLATAQEPGKDGDWNLAHFTSVAPQTRASRLVVTDLTW